MTTLVLGPSLGTSVAACWGPTIERLPGIDVVGVELPGHGTARGPVPDGLTVADLARRVLDRVEGPFVYAGDSVGGLVGLQLLLDAPERVLGAVLCCTAAKIGTAQTWVDRVAQVEASGTAGLVEATVQRWFAPGFLEREPARASALLHALRDADEAGYLAVCGVLRDTDLRDRLGEITAPVVAVAGAADAITPTEGLRAIADGVQHGRLVVLDDTAHQAPAERPDEVARIIQELIHEIGQETA